MGTHFQYSLARRLRDGAAVFGLMAAAAVMAGPSAQAVNLINNGTFTGVSSPGVGGSAVTGWSQAATNAGGAITSDCVVIGASFCSTSVWGSLSYSTFPGASPAGGNFFADALLPAAQVTISQSVTGLTVGAQYTLSFYQAGFTLTNAAAAPTISEQWHVSFGSAAQDSSIMNVSSTVGANWSSQTMTFTAALASQTLSFVTKLGAPASPVSQFAALGGVSLTQVAGCPPGGTGPGCGGSVPEPASLALLGVGLAGMVGLRRRRAKTNA